MPPELLTTGCYMAYKNKFISNTITGQSIKFLQTSQDTNGKLLEMESTYHAASKEPPMHYHPNQWEDFTVLRGELQVRVNGKLITLMIGDTLHIKPNEPHAMWNTSGSKVVVNWQVRPALNTEYLLETVTGLANDGKTNADGIPDILQMAATMPKFGSVFRLAKPPFLMLKIIFSVLTPFAWLKGKKPLYKQYLD